MQDENNRFHEPLKVTRNNSLSCLEFLLSEYRELYRLEIETRRDIEGKISARITFLVVLISIIAAQLKPVFQTDERVCGSVVLSILSITILVIQFVYFYLSFINIRLQYLEVELSKFRDINMYVFSEKKAHYKKKRYKIVTINELGLLGFIRDSYIKCADHNRNVNKKKKISLMRFDNLTLINFVITLANYFYLYLRDSNIQWIFNP